MNRSQRTTSMLLLATCGVAALAPTRCRGHNERVHEGISASAFHSSDGLQRFLADNLGSIKAPFLDGPLLFGHVPPLETMNGLGKGSVLNIDTGLAVGNVGASHASCESNIRARSIT